MSLDANIHGYSGGSVQGPSYIPDIEKALSEKEKKYDDLSTIEKSIAVAALMTPPPNFPILTAPSDDHNYLAFMVSSMDGSGKPMLNLLRSEVLKMEEIKNEILDGWLRNIEEIQEEVRQLINSPTYQALQEIRLKGDQHQGSVSGVQTATSANAAAKNPTTANEAPYNFLTALDRLRAFERIPSTATISDPAAPSDSTRTLSIPLMATMIINGGLALVSTEMTTSLSGMSSNAINAPVELVERLQPVYPQLFLQDIIPMVNLMVMAPIYYHAWDEAVSNIKERESNSHVPTAQNFAKDVIKMVSDPAFVMMTFVNKMDGADKMSPETKERLATMLKLILASVALSLLYSVEVGKVQSGKYWGMEAQEFREILTGSTPAPDSTKPKTTQEQLTATLISLVKAQLDSNALSPAERAQTVEAILAYIGQSHSIESLLDPVEVFNQVLTFDDPAKTLEVRPA